MATKTTPNSQGHNSQSGSRLLLVQGSSLQGSALKGEKNTVDFTIKLMSNGIRKWGGELSMRGGEAGLVSGSGLLLAMPREMGDRKSIGDGSKTSGGEGSRITEGILWGR